MPGNNSEFNVLRRAPGSTPTPLATKLIKHFIMNKDIVLGIVRHILTAVGGGLVTNGTLSSDGLQEAVGGVMALAGVIWSITHKVQNPSTK